jgi:hypothetical protein
MGPINLGTSSEWKAFAVLAVVGFFALVGGLGYLFWKIVSRLSWS